ncbi:MAG: hypothetical protein PVJ66_09880, partial [Gammaproteobacteria bacterium]
MLSEPKVLIIETDPRAGNELAAVLKFINFTPVYIGDCTRWREYVEGQDILRAVLVGSCGSDERLASLLAEIHTHDEHLPVYLLAGKGKEPTVAINPESCILGRLEIPANYSQLTSALHQAEVYIESHRSTTSSKRPVDLFRSLV